MVARALRFELARLFAEPAQHALGLGDMLFLAGEIARGLRQPRLELRLARHGARLFFFKRVALDIQPVQRRGALGFRVAQRLQLLGGLGLLTQRLALGLGLLRHRRKRSLECGLLLFDQRAGGDPMQMMLQRFGLADLAGDLAIALRLAGLALQRLQLRGELPHQVGQPGEIAFGCLEPQLRLVPPAMQACDARGIFEHTAALLRLRVDDLADAALAHERRRARAGRGVLEQQTHVTGPCILAVDPVGRARLALDPPRHLEHVVVVELGGRAAIGIVDEKRDLGAIARRTILAAGEDHVVHGRAAHALVRGLAHGPAQRLEQVRFAAAVRPDHPGETGLDQELGRLHEGLEAEKAEFG